MHTNEILKFLENAQSGSEVRLIQVDFLFAKIIHDSSPQVSKHELTELGKYNTGIGKPFQFYKPYSRIFNLNISENA